MSLSLSRKSTVGRPLMKLSIMVTTRTFSFCRVLFPAFLLVSQGLRCNAFQLSRGSLSSFSSSLRPRDLTANSASSFDNDVKGDGGSKVVFVGNLPFDYTEAELKALVLAKGVKGCQQTRIAVNRKSGTSRGFGYVDFDSEEAAATCLDLLDGLEVNGRPLKIDLDGGTNTPTKGRRQPQTSSEFSAFVGNLDFGVSADDVSTLVRSIVDENVPFKVRFAYTLESQFRGFGHIDFGSEEAVTKVVDALNGMQMMSRELRVERAEGKELRAAEESRRRAFESSANRVASAGPSDQHSIFLGNLAYDVSIENIVDLMDRVLGPGNVKAVRLSTDRETGQMKGFGHADFDTAEDAFNAASKLNGADLSGRPLKADVAVPKVRSFEGFNDSVARAVGGRPSSGGGGDRRGGDDAWGDSAGPRLASSVSSGSGRGGGGSRDGDAGGRGSSSPSPRGRGGSFREEGGRGRGSRDEGRGRGRGDGRGSGRGGGRGGSGRGGGRGGGYSSGADTGSFGAW